MEVDLYDSQIFDGNRDFNWGDIGTTYIIDENNGVGGNIDWENKDSFLEKHFPRVIDTTTNGCYNFFVKNQN